MAYVQEHKLGLNTWQLSSFLNPFWGMGETFAECLASDRGNRQARTLVLLCVGPSDHRRCAFSLLPAPSEDGARRCGASLCVAQLVPGAPYLCQDTDVPWHVSAPKPWFSCPPPSSERSLTSLYISQTRHLPKRTLLSHEAPNSV